MGDLQEEAHGRIRAPVGSQSDSETSYQAEVTLLENGLWSSSSCSCPDAKKNKKHKGDCKHVLALVLKAAGLFKDDCVELFGEEEREELEATMTRKAKFQVSFSLKLPWFRALGQKRHHDPSG